MLPNYEYTGDAVWRCASCGAWVPSGFGHVCGKSSPQYPAYYGQPAYYSVFFPPEILERIAKALETIAEELAGKDDK